MPKQQPAAPGPVPDFKALGEGLSQQEQALEEALRLLAGSHHEEARKSLQSVLDSTRSMLKLLVGLSGTRSGAMIMIVINHSHAHLQMAARLIAAVDSGLPQEVVSKLSAYLRGLNSWGNLLAHVIESSTRAPAAGYGVTAVAQGIGQALVTWSYPVTEASITDYALTATLAAAAPDGTPAGTTIEQWVGRGSGSAGGSVSAVAAGLRNGGTYTFTVRAINEFGEGQESPPSNKVILPGVPAAPTIAAVERGIGQATVRWTPPAADPLALITDYVITATLAAAAPDGTPAGTAIEQWVGRGILSAGGSVSAVATGLHNGGTYTFTVHAVNLVGKGQESAPYPPATATPPFVTLPDVPGKPDGVQVAVSAIGEATVRWTPPAADPLAPITDHVITTTLTGLAAGGVATTTTMEYWVGGDQTNVALQGLHDGGTYTFTVRAINALGAGKRSDPSASQTMPSVPGSPTQVRAVAGIGNIQISWAPPLSDGGHPITAYIVAVADNGTNDPAQTIRVDGATTDVAIPDLGLGHKYTVTVAARTDIGDSLPSDSVVVLVLSSYPAYPAFADVVLASEALAADKTVADEAFIRHLRGAGRAFAGFSRDPRFADASDSQFDTLVSNWGVAMEKMTDPVPTSGGATDGNAAVDRLIQIHDLLDKNYEFLRGGYSMRNPFDFGDL